MSIEGRIIFDALFHDRDGTASLKIVKLASSREYTASAVAFVTGTASTAAVTLVPSSGFSYKNAAGQAVSIASPNVIAIAGNDVIVDSYKIYDDGNETSLSLFTSLYSNGAASVTQLPYETQEFRVRAANSTTGYSIVVLAES